VLPPDAETRWRPGRPCPVGQLLRVHRRGPGDPTYRVDDEGGHWRGVRTPQGPATLLVRARPADGEVRGAAWGPGAGWALDALPALLGAEDDPSGFEPRHPVLVEAHRRHEHWRIGRTDRVWEAFLPAVIEQKVTGQEAFAGFRRLVHRFGERAPGPGAALRLWVQPTPEQVARVPSWEWLQAHVDPARSRVLVRAAGAAASLERLAAGPGERADAALRSLPGVGVWTSAEVRARALGDPDAVSFGDYHVAKDIGWALTGAPVDDDGLAELLEPWRGHRYRVQALLGLAGLRRPRRGPRMAPRRHLPVR
jgi:3-methyladenine DNA glycosylase/8-oxoguanine DNA glycosylase